MTVAIVVVRVIRRYKQYYTYLLLKSTNNEGIEVHVPKYGEAADLI